MAVFRVTVHAEGLRVFIDDAEVLCGFYKNEYVWASNADEAANKARITVCENLRRDRTINQNDVYNLKILTEGVEKARIRDFVQSQGFSFYKLGSADSSDSL